MSIKGRLIEEGLSFSVRYQVIETDQSGICIELPDYIRLSCQKVRADLDSLVNVKEGTDYHLLVSNVLLVYILYVIGLPSN